MKQMHQTLMVLITKRKGSWRVELCLPRCFRDCGYVMGMLAPAVGKNDNVGDDDVEKWSEDEEW